MDLFNAVSSTWKMEKSGWPMSDVRAAGRDVSREWNKGCEGSEKEKKDSSRKRRTREGKEGFEQEKKSSGRKNARGIGRSLRAFAVCVWKYRYGWHIGLYTRDVHAIAVNIVVIRGAGIGQHGAIGAKVIPLSVGVVDPVIGDHVTAGIKVVPVAIDLLPAGGRPGAVIIPIPVAGGIPLPAGGGAIGAAAVIRGAAIGCAGAAIVKIIGHAAVIGADVIQSVIIHAPALRAGPLALV